MILKSKIAMYMLINLNLRNLSLITHFNFFYTFIKILKMEIWSALTRPVKVRQLFALSKEKVIVEKRRSKKVLINPFDSKRTCFDKLKKSI